MLCSASIVHLKSFSNSYSITKLNFEWQTNELIAGCNRFLGVLFCIVHEFKDSAFVNYYIVVCSKTVTVAMSSKFDFGYGSHDESAKIWFVRKIDFIEVNHLLDFDSILKSFKNHLRLGC